MSMVVQLVALILVAVAMALSLAHALELPGKLRLDRQAYYAMQSIYYPGFTIGGGVGEFGGMVATVVLLLLTPRHDPGFWLTLAALLGLVAMQAVYWLFTHPVNRFWVEGQDLDRFSSGFFSFGAGTRGGERGRKTEWTALRDRWEYSQVARAVLGLASFVALAIAIAR